MQKRHRAPRSLPPPTRHAEPLTSRSCRAFSFTRRWMVQLPCPWRNHLHRPTLLWDAVALHSCGLDLSSSERWRRVGFAAFSSAFFESSTGKVHLMLLYSQSHKKKKVFYMFSTFGNELEMGLSTLFKDKDLWLWSELLVHWKFGCFKGMLHPLLKSLYIALLNACMWLIFSVLTCWKCALILRDTFFFQLILLL